MKMPQLSFLVILVFALSFALNAQIASYNFNNNTADQTNGHDATYIEWGDPSANTPNFSASNNGFQIVMDSTQGVWFPQSMVDEIDTSKSLEIQFEFTITDIGDGGGVTDLINCQAQGNEPGFTIVLRHDGFSSQDDFDIVFSYADGGFNQGVPDHPGHDETVIGNYLVGDVIDLRLIMDFEARTWSAIVNGSYISREFDDYYDWDFMMEKFKTNPWFFGWHEGQDFDMDWDPTIYTTTAALDELSIFSPRQAGDASLVITALQAMTAHANGSMPLSMAQRNNYLGIIYLNYFNNHNLVEQQVFEYIEAYETNYIPVYNNRVIVMITDLLPESQLLVFLQQSIFDNEYDLENLPNMEGLAFEFADVFPGIVDPNAERIQNAMVSINGTHIYDPAARVVVDLGDAKRPTGYYAAPGEIITVEIPTELADAGLKVMIGAHDADHSTLTHTNRFNRISKTYALTNESTQVLNPFGGGIYIKVPQPSNLGWVDVTISGAVKSPYFSWRTGHESNPADWAAELEAHNVEWVDLESDKYMMTLPLSHVASITNPTSLMEQWNDIMEGFRYVGGRPNPRPRSEYFAIDSRLPSNAFGTGYPQVIGEGSAPYGPNFGASQLYPTHVLNPNFWDSAFHITFHEMGHAVLHPTLITEVETIVHLNAVYVYNQLYGLSMDEAFRHSSDELFNQDEATMDWLISPNFRTNQPMDCDPSMDDLVCDELRYQHRGYAKYIRMADIFGWSTVYEMNKVFYDDWSSNEPEDWMLVNPDNVISAASYGSNINMAPLMHFYGLQPSEALREELCELPSSPEILEMLEYYKELTPANAAEFQAWYDVLKPNKDPVHYERYDYALANYDNDAYADAITNQIDLLIDLYFPGCGVWTDIETPENGVSVFPNPSNGMVNLQLANTKNGSITIMDINGKQITQQSYKATGKIQLQLPETAGIYFINIKSGDVIETFKVVKGE